MDNGTSSEKLNKWIGTNVLQHCRAGQQSLHMINKELATQLLLTNYKDLVK